MDSLFMNYIWSTNLSSGEMACVVSALLNVSFDLTGEMLACLVWDPPPSTGELEFMGFPKGKKRIQGSEHLSTS